MTMCAWKFTEGFTKTSPSKIWRSCVLCMDKCEKTFHAAWMTFEKEGGKEQ